jgi:cytochrome c biogenesis protein CcmG, thiol:disulfide interchange protein DsbE
VSSRLRHALLLSGAVLAGAGLSACGGDGPGSRAAASAGASQNAVASKKQANQLLDGGPEAFKARLAELRGRPVVVNQWASWCGPCKFEFPFFASQAKKYEGRVAFLGVNTQDNRKAAMAFLKRIPVPFLHFFDPDGKVARVFRGGRAFPTTAFYDASGRLVFTHLGAYPAERKLEEAIRRYALDG